MGSLGSKTQILYFQNKYYKRAFRNYTKGLQPGFPHSLRTLCPNFKSHEDKAKRPLLTFVSMSLICPISNGMFPSQSAPKVLLDPNKDIIGGNSTPTTEEPIQITAEDS